MKAFCHRYLSHAFYSKSSETIVTQTHTHTQVRVYAVFVNHREHNEFADVTLAYEDGQHIEAHKVILAVSSAFFQTLPK